MRSDHGCGSAGGPAFGIAPGDPCHGEAEQHGRDDAGNDAGDEQLADAGLGHDAVDHHDDRRRDQDAERAAGRDRAGGERVAVAVLAHRRIGHLGEGRGGRDRGAADRAEAGAGDDGGHGKPAAPVAEEAVGGVIELVGHPRAHHEVAHQDEQRDDRQRVGQPGLVGHLRDHRRGDVEVELVGDAGEADDAHGEGHRHAQEREDEESRKSDQRFGHGPTASPGDAAPRLAGTPAPAAPARSAPSGCSWRR